MSKRSYQDLTFGARKVARVPHLQELRLSYEGRTELVSVRPPDLSPVGMFINTPEIFPEGAVLKIQFRLPRSGHEVHARAEVRFCLAGVGIGLEFIGLPDAHARAIEDEIAAADPAGQKP